MKRKMIMLTGAALAALAFALPVSAASANWTMGGTALTANETVVFSGPMSFELPGGGAGASAELTAEIELEAGTTTGRVTSITANNCQGTGKLKGLTCTSTFEKLPWTVHAGFGGIQITSVAMLDHFYLPNDTAHSSPVKTTLLTGNIFATPNNQSAISSVSLEGEGTEVEGVPVELAGTLAASPAGTFGF